MRVVCTLYMYDSTPKILSNTLDASSMYMYEQQMLNSTRASSMYMHDSTPEVDQSDHGRIYCNSEAGLTQDLSAGNIETQTI